MAQKTGRPPRSAAEIHAMQARIATHALRLFHEEGFAAVSIRRLAKEAGCAPMTIYAHFDSKTDILRYLWADVLEALLTDIRKKLATVDLPLDRLRLAAQVFVKYWLDHTDHFRLVFLSHGISRVDVTTFIEDDATLAHFGVFSDLVQAALPAETDVKSKTDVLVAGMIGIALCANTIRDYPWTDPSVMTEAFLAGIVA